MMLVDHHVYFVVLHSFVWFLLYFSCCKFLFCLFTYFCGLLFFAEQLEFLNTVIVDLQRKNKETELRLQAMENAAFNGSAEAESVWVNGHCWLFLCRLSAALSGSGDTAPVCVCVCVCVCCVTASWWVCSPRLGFQCTFSCSVHTAPTCNRRHQHVCAY